MKTVQLIQGTPEWHAHRAQHFNASDAPAMLGVSAYKSRAELIRELATGAAEEIDEQRQRIFDNGHRYEALARPLAEEIIGEELYPCVGVDGKFSASFDGLTLLEDVTFEHKSLNDDLRAAMHPDCTGADLPAAYRVQMEHQLMVSGAERALFMASKWNGDDLVEERHCWYLPDLDLRAKLVAGWTQFEADVAAYEPAQMPVAAPVGQAPDQMPALRIEVTGMVTASNLAEWKDAAIAVFQGINKDLTTDQDFADAAKTVTWCSEIEDQLKGAKQHALSQTQSIDVLFNTIDAISEQARATRLALEKLVTARKEARRTEIGNDARRAVQDHVRSLNDTLGEHALPMPATLISDIQTAMKGKRSFTSMQEAIDVVVANAKIATSQQAERIRANVAILAQHEAHATLFADRVTLCATKAPDDLKNLVAARISEHEAKVAAQLEADRERIRKEEADKLVVAQKAEAARIERERAQAELDAAKQAPEGADLSPPAQALHEAEGAQRFAQHHPAVAKASAPGAQIKLGDINDWIAPLSVNAEGLASLGFRPAASKGAAKLYAAEDFPHICGALARVVAEAPARAALKKAA
jgi:putative phage-type endonuclease